MAQKKSDDLCCKEPTDSWFPPPLAFPEFVDNAFDYFDRRIVTLIFDPPLLGGTVLESSCENAPAGVYETLCEGQETLKEGSISAARAILEPIATRHIHASALTGLCLFALGRYHAAISYFEALNRRIPDNSRNSLYQSLVNAGRWIQNKDFKSNSEAHAMSLLCDGVGIDVGCGGEKTRPNAIGVDITPGGSKGVYGGQKSVASAADITASGDYLPMFENGALDFVISRHNLEHYQDYIKALLEWTRVLKPGGLLGIVAPDHEWVDTIRLDPTHYHVFTQDSLKRLFGLLPQLKLIHAGISAPLWSIMAIVQKTPTENQYDYLRAFNFRESEMCLARKERYEKEGFEKHAEECQAEANLLIGPR